MRVAISFTGGKDSVLATHLVLDEKFREIAGWTGEGDVLVHRATATTSDGGAADGKAAPPPSPAPIALPATVEVAALVTFGPPAAADNNDPDDERGFKAHPLRLVRAQAAAVAAGIAARAAAAAAASAAASAAAPASSSPRPPTPPPPYLLLDIVPPHADSYAAQLAMLKEQYGVEALVTGDVLDVCSGFMARACARAGLALVTPLWQQPRERILGALDALGIRSIVTCVDVRKFEPGRDSAAASGAAPAAAVLDPVDALLGRELTRALWAGPGALLRSYAGVDLCGEGGEYHTAAFEAPLLFVPPALRVEVKGHAFKGPHAHVLLGRVDAEATRA